MTIEYEKQLEEEIASLKNLLEGRTKQLDESNALLKMWENGTWEAKYKAPDVIQIDTSNRLSSSTFEVKSNICIDGHVFTSDDVANLKHLWSIHMQKVNNPPLLYRIWRKIVSCLNTKKN